MTRLISITMRACLRRRQQTPAASRKRATTGRAIMRATGSRACCPKHASSLSCANRSHVPIPTGDGRRKTDWRSCRSRRLSIGLTGRTLCLGDRMRGHSIIFRGASMAGSLRSVSLPSAAIGFDSTCSRRLPPTSARGRTIFFLMLAFAAYLTMQRMLAWSMRPRINRPSIALSSKNSAPGSVPKSCASPNSPALI